MEDWVLHRLKKRKEERLKNRKEIVVYVPSYCLSLRDPSRLTCMSLDTAKKGIEIVKRGRGDKIIFSTAYEWWKTEAKLKKDLAEGEGVVGSDLVEIIPDVSDSYDEAKKLRKIVTNAETTLILVAQKHHARRAALVLKKYFSKIEVVKVKTKMERQLDPSWLKSILCGSTMLNFILWNWFFNLITPYMMKRQMRKQKEV